MERREFKIEREPETFEKFEDWERLAVESYLITLEHKVNDFITKLEAIGEEFQKSYGRPEEIYWEKVSAENRDNWRVAITMAIEEFYGWGTASLSDFEQMLRNLSSQAKGWVHRKVRDAINWLLAKVIAFFRTFASHLQVQSWSVGGGVGFPFNIGINISVAFNPI